MRAGTPPASALEDLRTKDSWVPRANHWKHEKPEVKRDEAARRGRGSEREKGLGEGRCKVVCLRRLKGTLLAYEV